MHSPNKKIYIPNNAQRPASSRKPNPLANFSKEVLDLQAQQKDLQHKIKEIENRQRFGYSEPLNDYMVQLMKQDMKLTCQITDLLIPLNKKA
ncbi:MAG: hypothetical protein K0R66_665 [Gammaproteobacteria bacterium]|jgi:uncharacterized FlaG/YvyC family protein|nr:hypothetical protein [Gammaproteobacteria bacterium]